jgi:hypothetical protein
MQIPPGNDSEIEDIWLYLGPKPASQARRRLVGENRAGKSVTSDCSHLTGCEGFAGKRERGEWPAGFDICMLLHIGGCRDACQSSTRPISRVLGQACIIII